MAGAVGRSGRAPLQRPLPERWATHPTKRKLVDLSAELLRRTADLEASENARAALRGERDSLAAELDRARADNRLKDEVIAKMRERLARLETSPVTAG